MACFTLGWLENLLISIVVLAVVVAVLKLLIPWVLGMIGFNSGPVMQILNIIVIGIVVIWLIVLVFGLLSCLAGGGGLHFLPR